MTATVHARHLAEHGPRIRFATIDSVTRAGLRPLLGLLLATLAFHSWTLTLPFRVDDVTQIPVAAEKLAHEFHSVISDDEVPGSGPPGLGVLDRTRFRPALWLTFHALSTDTEELRAWPFYAAGVLMHGIVVCLLYTLLAPMFPGIGALAGCVVFALCPAGGQVLTWIAAQGDLLITLLGLSAFVLVLRAGTGCIASLAAGLFLAGAILTKSSGYLVLPPVIAAYALRFPGHGPGVVRMSGRLLAFVSAPGLAVWWRVAFTGSALPTFSTGATPRVGSVVDLLMDHGPSAWQVLAVPHRGDVVSAFAGMGSHPIVAWSVSLVVLGVFTLCAVTSPQRRAAILMSAGFWVLAIMPFIISTPLGITADHNTNGRLLYLPTLSLAVAVAATVDATRTPRGARWLVIGGRIAIIGFLLVQVDAYAQRIVLERQSAARIREFDRTIELLAEENPRQRMIQVPTTLFWKGSAQYGAHLAERFRRPFRPDRLDVRFCNSRNEALASGLLGHPGEVAIVDTSGERVAVSRLSAFTRQPEAALVSSGGRWLPGGALNPRGFSVVDVTVSEKARGLRCHIKTDTASWSTTVEVMAGRAVLLIGDDLRWVTSNALDHIEFDSGSRVGSVTLRDGLPRVRQVFPPRDTKWKPTDGLVFKFKWPGTFSKCRISFRVPVARGAWVEYEVPAERTIRIRDEVTCDLSGVRPSRLSNPGMTLSAIPALFAQRGKSVGHRWLVVLWRVDLLTPAGHVIARSTWHRVRYEPPR